MAALPTLLQSRAGVSHGSARRIVGVGQKMYLTYQETVTWLEGLLERARDFTDVDLFVLPSMPALDRARVLLAASGIFLGAQDLHWHDRGAFTGEVSPLSLAELGCTFVEIGHAERRALFGETDEMVRLKTAAALTHHLVPIICVGEEHRMDDREATAHVVRQVRAALEGASAEKEVSLRPIVVAYEPVWAIGMAASAPAAYVAPIITAVRRALASEWPGPSAILYGGSVRSAETTAFIDAAGADGVFVGRAALDLDELCAIVRRVAQARGGD